MNTPVYPYKVLYVEDDDLTRRNLTFFLKERFSEVYESADGLHAYNIYLQIKPDILFIDINIPSINGIELLQKVRRLDHNTKAIMLTAQYDLQTLLKATELKLTKYLIKPINRKQLLETIKEVTLEIESYSTINTSKVLIRDNIYWDTHQSLLYQHNQVINLTSNEKRTLELLYKRIGTVCTYDNIIDYVWNYSETITKDSVKTTIKNLRKKLPKDIISNIYGVGYQLKI